MPDYSDEDSVSSSSQSASVSVSVVPSISSGGFASLSSETSMKSEEQEHLFLKLEDSNARLSKKVRSLILVYSVSVIISNWIQMNFNSHDISIGQSAFVASCHFVVDELIKHVSLMYLISVWNYTYSLYFARNINGLRWTWRKPTHKGMMQREMPISAACSFSARFMRPYLIYSTPWGVYLEHSNCLIFG